MVHKENTAHNPAVPVKNFERLLVQRDLPSEPTVPNHNVMFKGLCPAGNSC